MSSPNPNSSPGTPQADPMAQRQIIRISGFGSEEDQTVTSQQDPKPAQTPPLTLSTHDMEALLNADLPAGVQIDTEDLCRKISSELTEHRIFQSKFSERILQRTQGTLSLLLNKPKPWKSIGERGGRKTYIRMYNWLSQPLDVRMAMLDVEPEVPAKRKSSSEEDESSPKRTKFVFNDIQLIILEMILKENRHPDTDFKQTVADHLGVGYLTIDNFFKNARRRPARFVKE